MALGRNRCNKNEGLILHSVITCKYTVNSSHLPIYFLNLYCTVLEVYIISYQKFLKLFKLSITIASSFILDPFDDSLQLPQTVVLLYIFSHHSLCSIFNSCIFHIIHCVVYMLNSSIWAAVRTESF